MFLFLYYLSSHCLRLFYYLLLFPPFIFLFLFYFFSIPHFSFILPFIVTFLLCSSLLISSFFPFPFFPFSFIVSYTYFLDIPLLPPLHFHISLITLSLHFSLFPFSFFVTFPYNCFIYLHSQVFTNFSQPLRLLPFPSSRYSSLLILLRSVVLILSSRGNLTPRRLPSGKKRRGRSFSDRGGKGR